MNVAKGCSFSTLCQAIRTVSAEADKATANQEHHEETAKLIVKNSLLNTGTATPKNPISKKRNAATVSLSRGLHESPQSTQRLEALTPKMETPAATSVDKRGEKKARRIQAAQPDALDHSKMKRLVEEGSVLMSRFLIDGMIAGGGFGQVYLGTDNVTGMKCAVKVQGVQGGVES